MKILLVEPFYSGSHKAWADGLRSHSSHEIDILALPGRHWKWRMHGGALTLARKYKEAEMEYDLVLASDMLDLSIFIAHSAIAPSTKKAIYFHENQLTYPWSPQDRDIKKGRDNHYAFINYSSALLADACLFNSQYHLDSFTGSMDGFLNQYPDHKEKQSVALIKQKSNVLYLGMELDHLLNLKKRKNDAPVLLWNHRWEYDKNPEEFYELLCELKKYRDFKLIIAGERFEMAPKVFQTLEAEFAQELIHYGYCKNVEDYHDLLAMADILPVTSHQDFFGGSVVEAMAAGCVPLLPYRLAYPEHLNDELKEKCLYNGKEDALHKLLALIDSPSAELTREVRLSVKKYDWRQTITIYDDIFEDIISS